MTIGDFLASANGLIIFTSAMLAITKFFGDRHRSYLTSLQERVEKYDFGNIPEEIALQELKREWDDFKNIKYIDFDFPIAALFIVLLNYPIIQILVLSHFSVNGVVKIYVILLFFILILASLIIIVRLFKVRRKNKQTAKDKENLDVKYNIVKAMRCEK